MKIVKGIINIVLAFILTIVIIANFALFLVSNTFMHKEYVMKKLEENNYYGKVEADIKNGFEEYRYQSGMPEEVFVDLYTQDMIKNDINSIIDAIYENKEIKNSSEEVRNNINQNINNYFAQNGITLNKEEEKNIDNFTKIISSVYENKTNIINKYVKDISILIKDIVKVRNIMSLILIVLAIFLILIILFINLENIDWFVKDISIALFASGILIILLNNCVNSYIKINDILLFTQSLSDIIKVIINDILSKFNYYGIIFIIIGIVGYIIDVLIIKNKKA